MAKRNRKHKTPVKPSADRTPRQPAPQTTRHPVRTGVNALLGLVTVAGVLYLVLSPDEIPEPIVSSSSDSDDATLADGDGGQATTPLPVPDSAVLTDSDIGQAVAPPRMPPLTFETTPEGARVARADAKQLAEWCRSVGLPNAPPIDGSEPSIADAVVSALREAASARTTESFVRMGKVCYALDEFQCAKQYFALAADADPHDFAWIYYVGCMCQAMGHTDEAIEAFAKALVLDDRYPVTHARLGQLYLDANRLDEAATHFRRYVSDGPEDWWGNVGLGAVALKRGDHQAALRLLRDAAKQAPDDFRMLHYHLAKTYAALGRNDLAMEHFDKVKKLYRSDWFTARDPLLGAAKASVDSTSALGEELARLQHSRDWPRLAALSEQLIQRRPGDTVMLANLASIYRAQKRFAEAHTVLDRAFKLLPESALLNARRAELFLTQREYEEARIAADAAIQLDQASPDAYNVLGRALFKLHRQDEAEVAMRKAVELDPNNASKVFVLGEILGRGGNSSDAIDAYERTLKLAPNHPLARQRIDQLQQGQ